MTAVEFHRLTSGVETKRAHGWMVSVLCHLLGVGSALLLMAEFEKPALTNPFRWNVAVVETPSPPQPSAAEPVPAPPEQQPVKQVVRSQPRDKPVVPVEQQVHENAPSVETREPMQQVTHEVVTTAEVSTERPAVQSLEPHAVVARAIATSQASVVEQVSAQVAVSSVVERAQPADTPAIVESAPQARVSEAVDRVLPSVEEIVSPIESATPSIERRVVQQRRVQYRQTQADYGWLRDALWSRIQELKRYPAQAKANHWEGKVIVEAVVRDDGEVVGLKVAESSGRAILDQEAMAVMRKASPLTLKHPLGKSQVTILIPISYRLDG